MTTTNTLTTIIKEAFAPYTGVEINVIRERLIVTTEGIATPLLTVKNFEFLAELHPLTMAMAIGAKLRESIAFHIEGRFPAFNPKVQTFDMEKAYKLAHKVENVTGQPVKATFSGDALTLLSTSTEYYLDGNGEPYGVTSNEVLFEMNNYFTRAINDYDAIVDEAIRAVDNDEDPFASASTMSFDEMMAEEQRIDMQSLYLDHARRHGIDTDGDREYLVVCDDPFAGGVAVDEDNLPF